MKKALSILMATALAATSLVGCGQAASSAADSAPAADTSTSSSTEETSEGKKAFTIVCRAAGDTNP